MKHKFLFVMSLLMVCLMLVCPVFAEETDAESETTAETEATAETETEEADADEGLTAEGHNRKVGDYILPTPTIDKVYLDHDEEGYVIIVVESKPEAELQEITAYLEENQGYPLGVEFYVNINNEGFVKVASRGEEVDAGTYSFDLPASYTGKYYKSAESYFQIQMRYVYDYDWVRLAQSDWSNTLEINPELSAIDMQKKADRAGLITTLLWIGGAAVLVVLAVVMLSSGDRRCPSCRKRVPKKKKVCPYCGADMKAKRNSSAPAPSDMKSESAEEVSSDEKSEPAAEDSSDGN